MQGDWQQPHEYATNDEADRPEPYTSMGCGFDVEAFKKLKEELQISEN